jgi:16S rRNA (adenine1518-N6/adenine1519-N6)-dimethyltransferase
MTHYSKVKPKKSLGQHFLTDENIIRKIADSVIAGNNHRVIELGAGTGALTEALVNRFDDVQAVELDRRAVEVLTKKFPDLSLYQKDMLKVDWAKLAIGKKKTHVIGNLPYQITSPVLFTLLANRHLFNDAILMMQKEVAERLTASIRSKEYGILTVQVQLMSSPEILFSVSPDCFNPPPKVESTVIKLKFDKEPLRCSDNHLKTVVRTAFNQRRKKLRNALSEIVKKGEQPDSFNFDKRAEAWRAGEYEKLTAYLEDVGILT